MRRREFIEAIAASAFTWPLAAHAQQPAMPVVGLVDGGSLDAFRKDLKEIGYIDGENVTVEYHWLEGQYDRLPRRAAPEISSRPS